MLWLIFCLANSKKSIAMESEYTSKEVAEILGYRTSLSADKQLFFYRKRAYKISEKMLEVLKPSISDSHWTALSRKREELSILPKKRTKNFIKHQNTRLKDQLEYLKKDIAYHKKSIESHNRQMELILYQLQIKN
jgi:IS1 family transposase